MNRTRHRTRTAVRVLLGAAAGALVGTGVSAAAHSTGTGGAGYGGSAGAIDVGRDGSGWHVAGDGFAANAELTVTIGSETFVVRADSFGSIDTVLPADADDGAGITVAGAAADGSTRSVSTSTPADPSDPFPLAAAGGGAASAVLLDTRRRRGAEPSTTMVG